MYFHCADEAQYCAKILELLGHYQHREDMVPLVGLVLFQGLFDLWYCFANRVE